MTTRNLGVACGEEDNQLLEDGAPMAASRYTGMKRKAAAVGAFFALSAVWAVAGRLSFHATDDHQEHQVANAEKGEGPEFLQKNEFPYGYQWEEMCGVDYRINKVLHNNLGGAGPDSGEEGIKYRAMEIDDGTFIRHIIVHLNAASAYNGESAHLNGWYHNFAQIHLGAGDHVKVRVHFTDMDGTPLKLKIFRMTFYDLDEAPGGKSQEYIIADNDPVTLRDHSTDVHEYHTHHEVAFEATRVGTGKDNPHDMDVLTKTQRDRSVVLTYHNIKQFHVTIGSHSGYSARAFEFCLHSALSCHKEKVPITTTMTTTSTMTTTTTSTTIDPAILAAQQRNIFTIIAAIVGMAAAIALIIFLLKRQKEVAVAEDAFFAGTS